MGCLVLVNNHGQFTGVFSNARLLVVSLEEILVNNTKKNKLKYKLCTKTSLADSLLLYRQHPD